MTKNVKINAVNGFIVDVEAEGVMPRTCSVDGKTYALLTDTTPAVAVEIGSNVRNGKVRLYKVCDDKMKFDWCGECNNLVQYKIVHKRLPGVNVSRRAECEKILADAQKRCTARTVRYDDLSWIVSEAKDHLVERLGSVNAINGAIVYYRENEVLPAIYDYPSDATEVKIRFGKDGKAFLVSASRERNMRSRRQFQFELTDKQKRRLVERTERPGW